MARGRPASRGWAERTWDPSAIGASHVGRSSLPTRLHRRHPGAFLSACRACASWCPRVGWDTLGAGGPPRTSETEERGGHERGIAEGKNRAEAERAGPGEGRRQSHQDPRAAVPGETASGALLKAICAGAPLAPTVKSPVSPGQWWPPGSRRNAGQPSHRLGQQNGSWDQAQAARARPRAWGGAPGEPGLVYLGGRKAPGPGRRGRAKRPRPGPRGEGPGAYPAVDGRRGLCTPSGLTQCSPSATHRQGGQQPGHCEAEPVPRASGEGASSPCARPCRCHRARLLHPVNPKQRRGPDSPAPASRVVLEFFWAVEALWDADSGSGGVEGVGGQGLTWQSLLSNRLMIGLLWVCPDLARVRRGLGTGRHPRPPPRTGRLTHSRQQMGPRGPSRRPGLASLLKGVVRVPPGALRMEAAPVFRSRGAGGLRVHRK